MGRFLSFGDAEDPFPSGWLCFWESLRLSGSVMMLSKRQTVSLSCRAHNDEVSDLARARSEVRPFGDRSR